MTELGLPDVAEYRHKDKYRAHRTYRGVNLYRRPDWSDDPEAPQGQSDWFGSAVKAVDRFRLSRGDV